MSKIIKLVRDRIPALIREGKWNYEFIEHRDADVATWLRHKLMEEVSEYLEDRNASELADIVEACFALASHIHHVAPSELLSIAEQKREDRGGYGQLICMTVSEESDEHLPQ